MWGLCTGLFLQEVDEMNVRKKLMAGGLALSVISAALPMTGCNSIKELDNSRECTVETVGAHGC